MGLGVLMPGPASVRREVTAAGAGAAGIDLPTPLAFWRFEEASGTRADSTGNGNSLASHGTLNSGSGKIGSGAVLTAVSANYLDIASNSTVAPGGTASDYCVGFWYNAAAIAGTDSIVSKWPYSGTSSFFFGFNPVSTHNYIRVLVSPSANGSGSGASGGFIHNPSGVDWTTGVWHSVLFWYDHTAASFYLQTDGGPVDNYSTTLGLNAGTANFRVGGDFAFRTCSGDVDCLAIWHVVPTASNRTSWHNGGLGHEWVGGAWV